MAIMYKNRLLCIITNYVNEPWHIHNFQGHLKCLIWTIDNPNQMQNMLLESRNYSEWFKKTIFEESIKATETPPTNMEKVIINFTFFLLNPFPKLQYAVLDFGDFEWDQCCHFERFQYAKHPICCIARPPSRHHHWSSLLLSIPIIIGMAIYENGANQTKWSHLTYSVIWSFMKAEW